MILINSKPVTLPSLRRFFFVLAFAWVMMLAWWNRAVVMDDPWITFRYAENLIAGEGLVFNRGERLEGFSNPTWVLVSAIGRVLHLEPLLFTRIVNVVLASAILWFLIAGWGGKIPGSRMAGLMLAGSFPFALAVVGGLETVLHGGLILMLAVGLAELSVEARRGPLLAAGGALALLVLSRPEGFLWFGLPFAALALAPQERKIRTSLIAVLLFGVIVLGALLTARWAYFGALLPNTVMAKTGGGVFETVGRGGRYFTDYFGSTASLVLFLVYAGLRRVGGEIASASESLSPQALLIAVGSAAGAMQLAFALAVGGDWMPGFRFLAPALPVLCLVAGLGSLRWFALFRLILLVVILWGNLSLLRSDPAIRWCRWASKEMGGKPLREPLEEVGKFLAAKNRPEAVVAGTEAGIIPYFSGMRFIDMFGLLDRHIARRPGGLHAKYDAAYVLGRKPDFIVLGFVQTGAIDEAVWPPDREMVVAEGFKSAYQEARRWPRWMSGADGELLPGFIALYERIPTPLRPPDAP